MYIYNISFFPPRISSAATSQTIFCSWTRCRSRLWGRPRVSPRMPASGPAASMETREEVQAVSTTTLLSSPCHPAVAPLWTVVSPAISHWTNLQNWPCLEAQTATVTVLPTESLKPVRGWLFFKAFKPHSVHFHNFVSCYSRMPWRCLIKAKRFLSLQWGWWHLWPCITTRREQTRICLSGRANTSR